jgi:ATP-dependent helicase HrpB
MRPLPIDPYLPTILERLQTHSSLILQAQPGTGKTSRVPRALLHSAFCAHGKEVWVLEPRRLAAKLAAERVAFELGEPVGKKVGYQFRFEKVGGPETQLRFLTEGIFPKLLQNDPLLSRVSVVVLDEFHERHLQGDIALAALQFLQKTRRPDLKILLMSATLSFAKLETYLLDHAKLEIAAPHFPLATKYFPSGEGAKMEATLSRTITHVLGSPDYPGGDFLVFLPGKNEIRRSEEALRDLAKQRGFTVHPLHGELGKEEQEKAIRPSPSTKVILATNIAESSLTIEGVRVVIDSGLHRSQSVASWSGMPSLRVRPISKASATQRSGRAARTGPGLCVRLYSETDFECRAPSETPEVLRADLTATVLDLGVLGVLNEPLFEWFEPPSDAALTDARALLFRLGAFDSSAAGAKVTTLGRRLAKIPLHPRLGRMLLGAEDLGCLKPATRLAAALSEDRLEGLDALEAVGSSASTTRIEAQIARLFPAPQEKGASREALTRAALSGFPDRVGRLRENSLTELVMSSGGVVSTENLGSFGTRFFLVLNAREVAKGPFSKGEVRATSVIPLQENMLFEARPSLIETEEIVTWDSIKQKVVCKSRLRYAALILEESTDRVSDFEAAARVLLHQGLRVKTEDLEKLTLNEWIERLSPVCSKERLDNLAAKQTLVREHLPQHSLPTFGSLIQRALVGKISLEELREMDWEEALMPNGHGLPSSIQLPGGKKVVVNYSLGRAPWIESRLQDFFGMKTGPAILGGKIPLQVHLLAPNHRAVQVTTDLSGFWRNTYPAVRRELSRNYPRHSWPEDPANATPPKPKRYS